MPGVLVRLRVDRVPVGVAAVGDEALEPLMTHWLPFFTAVVFMPETSEPASGSVRQNDASLGSSQSMPRYFFFSSSDAATSSGAEARPLQLRDVAMPEQPQPI